MPKKDAVIAVEDEPQDLPDDGVSTVEWRGETFTFPANQGDWPTKAMQSFSAQRHPDGVERLLGPQQWELLNELGPSVNDFWDFMVVFAAAAGFDKA